MYRYPLGSVETLKLFILFFEQSFRQIICLRLVGEGEITFTASSRLTFFTFPYRVRYIIEACTPCRYVARFNKLPIHHLDLPLFSLFYFLELLFLLLK